MPSTPTSSHRDLAPRSLSAALGLAALLLAMAPATPAEAQCSQVGNTVNCIGNDPNGFDAGVTQDLDVNVLPGATVQNPAGSALRLNDGNTVDNAGTLTNVADDGINAGSGNVVVNGGTGSITAADDGVEVGDGSDVTNDGTIDAGDDGIQASATVPGQVNRITNAGSITAGDDGIEAGSDDVVTNTGTGSITAAGDGIEAASDSEITNQGSITAGDGAGNGHGVSTTGSGNTIRNEGVGALIDTASNSGGNGIDAGDREVIVNAGEIDAADVGINAGSFNSITNTVQGSIDTGTDATDHGIQAVDRNTIRNAGTIGTGGVAGDPVGGDGINAGNFNSVENETTGTINAAGNGITVGSDNDVRNDGALGDDDAPVGGNGIQAGDRNTITNSTLGTIDADGVGIQAGNDNRLIRNEGSIDTGTDATDHGISVGSGNVIENAGAIGDPADEVGGAGIEATSGNTIRNESSGTIDSVGAGIQATSGNTITNLGEIQADGDGIAVTADNTIVNATGATVESETGNAISATAGNEITNSGLVRGSSAGMALGIGNTVENSGQIQDAQEGITAGSGNRITNTGFISGLDDAIEAGANTEVSNDGTITAGDANDGSAVEVGAGSTVVNLDDGILDTGTGDGGTALLATGDGSTIDNQGTIIAADDGIEASDSVAGQVNLITNSGAIAAGQDGIEAGDDDEVTNTVTGTIDAGEDGVEVGTGARVENLGSITADEDGVVTGADGEVLNDGTITAGDSNDGAGIVAGAGSLVTNQDDGLVDTASNDGGHGIVATGDGNTILNEGEIDAADDGVNALGADNEVTNTGTIGAGQDGIETGTGSTVSNQGTITAGEDGIETAANGTVTNEDTITADGDGIRAGAGSQVTNEGTITAGDGVATSSNGIELVGDGSSATNENGGLIDTVTNLGGAGIFSNGNDNTVTNEGDIQAAGDGIEAGNGSMGALQEITNAEDGTITSRGDGIDAGSFNDIENAGSITTNTNNGARGIAALSDNEITNVGLITTSTTAAHGVSAGSNNVIRNANGATITTGGAVAAGILVTGSGNTVTNEEGALIDASGSGIASQGNANTITNDGIIEAGIDGIDAADDNPSIVNNGTIIAGDDGIEAGDGNDAITNNGTIIADGDGISAGDSNAILNEVDATITAGANGIVVGTGVGGVPPGIVANRGSITADGNGIEVSTGSEGYVVVNEASGTISTVNGDGVRLGGPNNEFVNLGDVDATEDGAQLVGGSQIVNQAGGSIAGDDDGVEFESGDGGFVDNFGVITGDADNDGTGFGIRGGAGADTVVNHSGALINGDIDMGAGDDLLRLETSSALANPFLGSHVTDGGEGAESIGDRVVLFGDGSGSYDGRFANVESLEKVDDGTWTLSGGTGLVPSVADQTTVFDGTLLVDGFIQTDVEIETPGTLGGNGTIDGNVNNDGGTIAPGSSIGTLTVGSYTESAASTHLIDIDAAGNTDLLAVDGTHTLFSGDPGSQLSVVAEPGDYVRGGEIYDFVISGGGLDPTTQSRFGTFDSDRHTVSDPSLKLYLDYLPDRIQLVSIPLDFEGLGTTNNEDRLGRYLDRIIPTGICETDLCFIASRIGLEADVGAALDQLHGDFYDANVTVAFAQARMFLETATSRIGEIRNYVNGPGSLTSRPRRPYQVADVSSGSVVDVPAAAAAPGAVRMGVREGRINPWARFIASAANKDDTSSHIGYDFDTFGGAGGVDFLIGDRLLIGIMAGGGNSDLDWDKSRGTGDAAFVQGGLYASYFGENWFFDGAFAIGRNFFESRRNIDFGVVDRVAGADYNGWQYAGRVETGYRFAVGEGWGIEPRAAFNLIRADIDDFVEKGAGEIGLRVNDRNEDSMRTEAGLRVTKHWRINEDFTLVPEARAAWTYEIVDDSRTIRAAFVGTTESFRVRGDNPSRSGGLFGAGATLYLKERLSFYGSYTGDVVNDRTVHGGSVGLRLRF
ncbi:MAG: autotransporter domain-containing protein [Myxococcota bacterium]|nr:autotransporter domain-containing protein [Myxococcota bacterium]